MKTAEARDKIIKLVQWPNQIHIPQNRRKEIDKVLESYAKEHVDERCENCMHSYHNKNSKGYHDIEEFYKEEEIEVCLACGRQKHTDACH